MKKLILIAAISIGAHSFSFAQEQVQTLPQLTKRQCTYLNLLERKHIDTGERYLADTYSQNIPMLESIYEKQMELKTSEDVEEFQFTQHQGWLIAGWMFLSEYELDAPTKYPLVNFFRDAINHEKKLIHISVQEKILWQNFLDTLQLVNAVSHDLSKTFKYICEKNVQLESTANSKQEMKVIDEYYLSLIKTVGLDQRPDFPQIITWDL